MTTSQLHEFARIGAEARLKAIAEERQAIFTAFPELRDGAAPAKRTVSAAAAPARKRRGMSPAQRKVVGQRMKAYWAKRRTEKAGTTQAEGAAARQPSKRQGMSAEARKAQGERMRAYWAARRARKAGDRAREKARTQDGPQEVALPQISDL